MRALSALDWLFVGFAFLMQVVLVAYFAWRKARFEATLRWGWLVYALGLVALAVSATEWVWGAPWWMWLGGVLAAAWAVLGYTVDVLFPVPWRNPPYWPVFTPYVALYLAMQMFYWWPVGMLWRPLWYAYAVLFVLSAWLNITSHRRVETGRRAHT